MFNSRSTSRSRSIFPSMISSVTLVLSLGGSLVSAASSSLAPSQIASIHALPSSTSLAMPTATLDPQDAINYLDTTSGWQISKKGHISQPGDVSFAADPIDSTNTQPVLAAFYPAGSYSSGTGGTSFSTYFNDSSATDFRTMLLSYDLAFESGFQFVKGGKLPGLRGGDLTGCDGGANSDTCFSTRLMWRTAGAAEAYTYLQDSALCKDSNVICNDDGYGTSIGRGDFTWATGAWNHVDMVVGLNNPPTLSNGFLEVYHNGVIAINQTGLQIRSSTSVASIQGIFFSTFFGGADNTWATPVNQSTYYRNFQMWGSDGASLLTTKSSARSSTIASTWGLGIGALMGLVGYWAL